MRVCLNKSFDLKELIPVFKEQLDACKTVSFVPNGSSMRPMLNGGEDLIMLVKPSGRLRLFDVALYYRKETGKYVVHRVVGFRKDGSYIFLGDNNMEREYGITDEDIIGVFLKIAKEKIVERAYPFDDTDDKEMPSRYGFLQCEIAAYLLNKRGGEGETQHSENGIERTYESASVPDSMLKEVVPFSKALGV